MRISVDFKDGSYLTSDTLELALQETISLDYTEDDVCMAEILAFLEFENTNITKEFKSRLRSYSNAG